MGKYIYPAVFSIDKEVGGYTVEFPDLLGCVTEGDDLEESIRMAKDVLAGYLYTLEEDGDEIPPPSNPNSITLEQGEFVSLIEVWTKYIRDEIENKAVKKTLTIPKWLNDVAEEEDINFSHLLQLAIKEKLGIMERN